MPDALSEILASRRVLYAADGEMYRRALSDEATSLALDVQTHPRKPVFESGLGTFVAALGRELGPPWQKDHRTAAAAAIQALASYTTVRLS